jgi:hypothetical protein
MHEPKNSPNFPRFPNSHLLLLSRKTSDPTGAAMRLKATVFDTPKSPFEERMQQQANQLRKASVGSSDTDTEGTLNRPKFSIDGGMAQGFAAAVAQNPTRHERYAAHIPVASGRQSVTSMESVNRWVAVGKFFCWIKMFFQNLNGFAQ